MVSILSKKKPFNVFVEDDYESPRTPWKPMALVKWRHSPGRWGTLNLVKLWSLKPQLQATWAKFWLGLAGVIRFPHFLGIKQCKCMAIVRDFSLVRLFGWAISSRFHESNLCHREATETTIFFATLIWCPVSCQHSLKSKILCVGTTPQKPRIPVTTTEIPFLGPGIPPNR